ncbi:hypothetical protein M0805_009802 [Coniferiporia weirii]|nr:hypothetical protein M0805_009802 [Coniferiporia weirii]
MPRKHEWETITKWGKEYGDIVRVNILGRDIIFLNTAKVANDLFDKKSAIYSDRPRLPLLNELMGFEWNFGFMPYGEVWRKYRRFFVGQFGPSNVHIFNPVQELASGKLLKRLLSTPEDFIDHLRLHAGQLIMMSVYGISIDSRQHPFVTTAQEVMDAVSDAARPGAWLVDSFPILKKVPAWFPGAFYQRVAKRWGKAVFDLRWNPYGVSKEKLAEKQPEYPSYVSELIGKYGCEGEMETIIRDSAALAYGAGSDTSVSTLSAFILAMVLYPEVRKKAQAELDAAVGSSRLPSFSDREDLPYITAIAKETIRWHTVAPQALPHLLKEDDVHNGYYLPAGSMVVGNTWGIMHDPAVYPDPMNFVPERFFNSGGKLDYAAIDPAKYSFGYGRRICAGYQYAENTLWITIAFVLATMDVTHATDKAGKLIPAVLDASSGVISHPKPFKCSIKPRSAQAESLIHNASIY